MTQTTRRARREEEEYRYAYCIAMTYPKLLAYALLAVRLAAFSTFLALKRYKGCLPATLGPVRLPTLANLVDDWRTNDKGKMWWGDKTPENRMEGAGTAGSSSTAKHAGTSPDKALVGPIHEDCPYAGSGYGIPHRHKV